MFGDLGRQLVAWTPRVVVMIALILLALLFAKIAEQLLKLILVRLRFDALGARIGLDSGLRRIGVQRPLSHVLPRIFYWVLLFLFARTVADSLGLAAISSAIGSLISYLPNVVAALLIFLVGSAAAQYVGRTVTATTAGAGFAYAKPLGRLTSGVVLFVLGIMALGQLQIETEIIRLFAAGVLAVVVLALGLSFGLGSREITKNLLAGFYARHLFDVGDPLEIRGVKGTLDAITPTQFVVREGDDLVAMANSTFLEEMARSR